VQAVECQRQVLEGFLRSGEAHLPALLSKAVVRAFQQVVALLVEDVQQPFDVDICTAVRMLDDLLSEFSGLADIVVLSTRGFSPALVRRRLATSPPLAVIAIGGAIVSLVSMGNDGVVFRGSPCAICFSIGIS